MPDPGGGKLRHIIVKNTAKTEPYTYPKEVRGGAKVELPTRSREAHGKVILRKLDQVRSEWRNVLLERKASGIIEDRGLYLEFQSESGFELALKSLERTRERIELVSVRERESTQ
jgi:hypothetical protein